MHALALAGLLLIPALLQADPLNSVLWQTMHASVLNREPVVFDDKVVLTVPDKVEDGHFVPVSIDARRVGKVREIRLFADYNPIARALRFELLQAQPRLSVTMRVNQGTPIRAAALDEKGVWHVGSRLLDAPGGGCALPSQTRSTTDWGKLLGKINGRAWRETDQSLRIRAGIMHPMDTGLVSNIPRFNLDRLSIHDATGIPLARFELDASLAENPLLTLFLSAGYQGPLQLKGQDNDGNHYQASLPLPN